MAFSRYANRRIVFVDHPSYSEYLRDRGANFIRIHETPQFKQITASEYAELTKEPHIWKAGDTYTKLAFKYYGDVRHAWVIGRFNALPCDVQVRMGQVISIPLPLDTILSHYAR